MNLDDEATQDEISAIISPEKAKKLGFRDGFVGMVGTPVSPEQTAYFWGFLEGRNHRKQVDLICEKEQIDYVSVFHKDLA
jgi:hypothetical protein